VLIIQTKETCNGWIRVQSQKLAVIIPRGFVVEVAVCVRELCAGVVLTTMDRDGVCSTRGAADTCSGACQADGGACGQDMVYGMC
jgi:hypothetical protein